MFIYRFLKKDIYILGCNYIIKIFLYFFDYFEVVLKLFFCLSLSILLRNIDVGGLGRFCSGDINVFKYKNL